MYECADNSNLSGIKDIAEQFERQIEYYIQKPKAIYHLPIEFNKQIYKCGSIISRCYTYLVFDVVLIEYHEYALLIIRGSNE